MTRRRISLALITAATALCMSVPAQAATTEDSGLSSQLSSGSSALGSSSAEETETPTGTPTETPTETETPAPPAECEEGAAAEDTEVDADATEDEAVNCEPEVELGSLAMTEEWEWVFLGFEAFFSIGTAVVTAMIAYAKAVPGGDAKIREFLNQFGINV